MEYKTTRDALLQAGCNTTRGSTIWNTKPQSHALGDDRSEPKENREEISTDDAHRRRLVQAAENIHEDAPTRSPSRRHQLQTVADSRQQTSMAECNTGERSGLRK